MNILSNKIRNEIMLSVGLLLIIPIWIGLAPLWYLWYEFHAEGTFIFVIYTILDSRWLVNIPICIVLSYIAFKWANRIWNDYYMRFFRFVLVSIGFVVLFYKGDSVAYANIIGTIDYRSYFSFLLSLILLSSILKTIRRITEWHRTDNKCISGGEPLYGKGFTDDNPLNGENIPDFLKNYANEIVERLLKTNIKERSYALGVTGSWGVGKSSFLKVLEDKAADKADVISFNPWMCNSPEQITKDFFISLSKKLSLKYSMLSRPIKDYSKYLSGIKVTANHLLSFDFHMPNDSLEEKKSTLSNIFSKLPRPVVVIIDDLDRLERDEVFEVLRLIRNTADLKNIIYIVAYDKEYVTSVLKDKKIEDSYLYLEKIFPVEVHLPLVEKEMIWDTLMEDIEKQNNIKHNFSNALFENLYENKDLILSVLDNYRRAKRFARLFMLNIGFLYNQYKGDFKILDVFWLELLQTYDKYTYDILASNPQELLDIDGGRYIIKKSATSILAKVTKDKYLNKGDFSVKTKTIEILNKLFGKDIKTIPQSICFTENYEKFFILSIPRYRMSVKERNQLFEAGADPESVVERWLSDVKYFSSITYQLNNVSIDRLDDKQLKNYIYAVLYYSQYLFKHYPNHFVKIKPLFWRENYPDKIEIIHNHTKAYFEDKMNDEEEQVILGDILNRLYTTIYYNSDDEKLIVHNIVLNNNEIENLLVELLRTYLIAHEELSALDLLRQDSGLMQRFKNCCVCVEDREYISTYNQVAFDLIMKHFSSMKQKPKYEEYDKTINALLNEPIPKFKDEDEENDYWSFINSKHERMKEELFGSNYETHMREFKERCFVP